MSPQRHECHIHVVSGHPREARRPHHGHHAHHGHRRIPHQALTPAEPHPCSIDPACRSPDQGQPGTPELQVTPGTVPFLTLREPHPCDIGVSLLGWGVILCGSGCLYEQGHEFVLAATGVSVGKRQLEQLVAAAAAGAERFCQDPARARDEPLPAAGRMAQTGCVFGVGIRTGRGRRSRPPWMSWTFRAALRLRTERLSGQARALSSGRAVAGVRRAAVGRRRAVPRAGQ